MRLPLQSLIFILTFLTAVSALQAAPHAESQPEPPPNIIVIFCDDMGYGDLSCFGNPTIETPRLDQMAAQGQKWTQFYSADPVCTPSRAGLLTGRYPIRNGMTSAKRGVLFPDSAKGLPPEEVTIAEMLKAQGYATAAVGKWHLGHLPEYLPTRQGFDYYFGIPYSNDMDRVKGTANYRAAARKLDFRPDYHSYNVPLIENGKIIERPVNQNTITRRYTEKAVEFIRSNSDRPFFLYLAHSMPHIPLFVHDDWDGSSRRGLYGDVIQEIDWSVGQVLDAIRERGLSDNTIVVFTSDNGPWLSYKEHGGSAGPLRAGKGTTFEGGQRVPTIFWGPGILEHRMVTAPASTIDLMATFAALTGAELPDDRKMDSIDLLPVIKDRQDSARNTFFYWAFGKLHAVRSGPWKLHILQREPISYGREVQLEKPELYNLEVDISESYDVADLYPEKVAELLQLIEQHKADTADSLPDQLAPRLPEARKMP